MNPIIKSSIPDELRRVSKDIKEYAYNLKEDMRKLSSTHEEMYQHWSGRQYDDFTEVIHGVNEVIIKETDSFDEIAEHVLILADQLQRANEVDVK